MTAFLVLFMAWLLCAFLLGVFVGRFIRVGQRETEPVSLEARRQQLNAGLGRRVS